MGTLIAAVIWVLLVTGTVVLFAHRVRQARRDMQEQARRDMREED